MAPKKQVVPASETCIVERCICVRGYGSNGESIVVPVEDINDTLWVQFSTSAKWIRSLFNGKQAFDEKLALAITNANTLTERKFEDAKQKKIQDQKDSENSVLENVKAVAQKLDVSESEDEGTTAKESPTKKSKTVISLEKMKQIEVAFDGLDRRVKVNFNGKSIRVEATVDAIQIYLAHIHAELRRVRMLGLRNKAKEGVATWMQKLGVTPKEIVIPKIVGKVFYSPSQSSWAISIEDDAGEVKTITKGLKVELNEESGEALGAIEQMRAIVAGFPNACDEWNNLDQSNKARIDPAKYMA